MIIDRAKSAFSQLNSAWHNFWFEKQSPEPIALFRILFGFFVLQISFFQLIPNFFLLFGIKGMFDTSTVLTYWWHKTASFNGFLLLPQLDSFRVAFFVIFIVFAVFFTLGFFTRFSAIIVYLGLLTFDRQCPFVLNGGDDFMRVISFLLIFSPAGEAYSFDRMIKAKIKGQSLKDMPPSLVSPWVQRMIQVQLSLAYLFAVLPKIGDHWQSGAAVYYALQLNEFARFPLPTILKQFWICKFLTYYTLFVEMSMATLVWFKPFRYWILLLGVFLHLGIDFTMNLPVFEWLFLSSYVLFIGPQDLKRAISKIFSLFKFKAKTINSSDSELKPLELKPKITQDYNDNFLPTFVFVLIILAIGSSLILPLRKSYTAFETQRNYNIQLSNTFRYWNNLFGQCKDLPFNDENKLKVEENLAIILSLKKEYKQTGELLRNICQYRSEQKNKAYNPELIRALSALGNIYLETGHLEASKLCYKTIFNYDEAHKKHGQSRLAIDLNNLANVTYFQAILTDENNEKRRYLLEADTLFRQALNNLHNPQNAYSSGILTDEANIRANRYLCLRDLGQLKRSEIATIEAGKLNSLLRK